MSRFRLAAKGALMKVFAVTAMIALAALPTGGVGKTSTEGVGGPRTIELRISVDHRASATLGVPAGEAASVTPAGKETITLVPIDYESRIELVVSTPGVGDDGLDSRTEVGRYRLDLGQTTLVYAAGTTVEVTWVSATEAVMPSKSPAGPCSQCCIPCEGGVFCGCFVLTVCGSCCCPAACKCPEGPGGTSGCSTPNRSRQAQASSAGEAHWHTTWPSYRFAPETSSMGSRGISGVRG